MVDAQKSQEELTQEKLSADFTEFCKQHGIVKAFGVFELADHLSIFDHECKGSIDWLGMSEYIRRAVDVRVNQWLNPPTLLPPGELVKIISGKITPEKLAATMNKIESVVKAMEEPPKKSDEKVH